MILCHWRGLQLAWSSEHLLNSFQSKQFIRNTFAIALGFFTMNCRFFENGALLVMYKFNQLTFCWSPSLGYRRKFIIDRRVVKWVTSLVMHPMKAYVTSVRDLFEVDILPPRPWLCKVGFLFLLTAALPHYINKCLLEQKIGQVPDILSASFLTIALLNKARRTYLSWTWRFLN